MDICDAAQDIIDANTARAVAFRKPVPTTCEDCDEPCAVLPNGARTILRDLLDSVPGRSVSILARIQDWLRERRIRTLAAQMKRAVALDMHEYLHVLWVEYRILHLQRSAGQVARDERAKGLR